MPFEAKGLNFGTRIVPGSPVAQGLVAVLVGAVVALVAPLAGVRLVDATVAILWALAAGGGGGAVGAGIGGVVVGVTDGVVTAVVGGGTAGVVTVTVAPSDGAVPEQ